MKVDIYQSTLNPKKIVSVKYGVDLHEYQYEYQINKFDNDYDRVRLYIIGFRLNDYHSSELLWDGSSMSSQICNKGYALETMTVGHGLSNYQ